MQCVLDQMKLAYGKVEFSHLGERSQHCPELQDGISAGRGWRSALAARAPSMCLGEKRETTVSEGSSVHSHGSLEGSTPRLAYAYLRYALLAGRILKINSPAPPAFTRLLGSSLPADYLWQGSSTDLQIPSSKALQNFVPGPAQSSK